MPGLTWGMAIDTNTLRARVERRRGSRFLLYSHDSYGLGHLRRTLALARTLVAADPAASVLILSGSPLSSSYRLPERVDIVKLPSITKKATGGYASLRLNERFEHVSGLRAAAAMAIGRSFDPHVMLVDKTPAGLRGELLPLLQRLRERGGCRNVLGLREIEDEAGAVRREWQGQDLRSVIERYYDQVVVYGPPEGLDALSLLGWRDLGPAVLHSGYVVTAAEGPRPTDLPDAFVLVTVGGGGDGAKILRVVARSLERAPWPLPVVVVTGPLMDDAETREISDRFGALGATVCEFRPDMERVIASASAVISRAGYNTCAELVSSGRPALLVPRVAPREEQLIRAQVLARRGLALMIDPREITPTRVTHCVRALLARGPSRPDPTVQEGAAKTAACLLEHAAAAEAEQQASTAEVVR